MVNLGKITELHLTRSILNREVDGMATYDFFASAGYVFTETEKGVVMQHEKMVAEDGGKERIVLAGWGIISNVVYEKGRVAVPTAEAGKK